MISASSSGQYQHWSTRSRDGQNVLPSELAEISAVTHNGVPSSIQPEEGTGVWNWWEIANSKIVGEACDRWLEAYYKRTSDRMVVNREYFKARNNRDFTLALQQKRDAERQQSPTP
jgi:hypothetical protein